MKAYFYDLYQIIGIFIPLIVTNCVIIIARAESFASKNNVSRSFVDGLMMGLGFTSVLLVLAAFVKIIVVKPDKVELLTPFGAQSP